MRTKTCLVPAALAVSIALCAQYARAEDSSESARAALASLETMAWLGGERQRWAKYLDLPTLHAELDKGNTADPGRLTRSRNSSVAERAGLELAPFAELAGRDSNSGLKNSAIARAPGLPEAAIAAEAYFIRFRRPICGRPKAAAHSGRAARLDRFLKPSGANGTAWKEFLRWKDLQEQLASPSPDAES